jgi:hypothetical protein
MRNFTNNGYDPMPIGEYLAGTIKQEKKLLVRHDVDDLPMKALKMAEVENAMGIRSSYFFRDVRSTFKPNIIKQISSLGHEIGLHYESFSRYKGHPDLAINDFRRSMSRFRELVKVETICAHGDSTSPFDNRQLLDYYDLKSEGVKWELSKDIDYSETLYLTDTGGSWNSKFNRRDLVVSEHSSKSESTLELIREINHAKLPKTILINIHPQRWSDNLLEWYALKQSQRLKNLIKYYFFLDK